MSNTTMTPEQAKIWEMATKSDYVNFSYPAVLEFVSDDVAVVKSAGVESFEFDVMQEINGKKEAKILGTRSKGLMRGLMQHYPFVGKVFQITRTGEGYQTEYMVEEI